MSGAASSTLIDLAEVDKWNEAHAATPYRIREGAFRVPEDASPGVRKSELRNATVKFLTAMDKRHLILASKQMDFSGPFEARTVEDVVLPGYEEFRIRALFKYTGPVGVARVIEIPSILFRHNWGEEPDLDDINVVKELYKALGE
jgi:hypothetical protein